MNVIKLVVLVLGLAAFSQANAQTEMQEVDKSKRFAKIDADGSGSFDLNEFTAFKEKMEAKRAAKRAANGDNGNSTKERKPKDPAKIFNKMDADSNGSVDLAEFNAFASKKKVKRAKRKAKKALQENG